LGLMTSCIGIGALGAAGLQMILDPNLLQRTWLRLTLILLGIASGVVMVSVSSFEIASACAAVLGFTGIMSAVSLQASMQAVLPDDMRGRVMALWMMAASLATAVCALGITTLAEFYGFAMVTQSVLVICAIAIVTVALIKHEG
jgi:sugar phosphate permease